MTATLPHGYAPAALDQLTRAAVLADRTLTMDYSTRYNLAWSAIAWELCTATEAPTRGELVRAGWRAIANEVETIARHRGRPHTPDPGRPEQHAPRFQIYWQDHLVTGSPEHRIVEDIAVDQVLTVLTGPYRAALEALALWDDYELAAHALGITDDAFKARISRARRRVLAAWHQGENPHHRRTTDRRVEARGKTPAACCGRGHEFTPENTAIQRKRVRGRIHTSRACKRCMRDRKAARKQETA
jgi:hypothetical protein